MIILIREKNYSSKLGEIFSNQSGHSQSDFTVSFTLRSDRKWLELLNSTLKLQVTSVTKKPSQVHNRLTEVTLNPFFTLVDAGKSRRVLEIELPSSELEPSR